MTIQNQTFYTSIAKRGNKLLVREIDNTTGQRLMNEVYFKPFLYLKTNDPSKVVARGLLGEQLEKMEFVDFNEMNDFIERYKSVNNFNIYGCRDPVTQFIASVWNQKKIDYNFNHIRGCILDIETESGHVVVDEAGNKTTTRGLFTYADKALYPITAVTLYDSKTKAYITLGLETFDGVKLGTYTHNKFHKKIGECKVIYKGFQTEEDLLKMLVSVVSAAKFDFISGWNSDGFDIPYITNRVCNILGESASKKLSPWGIMKTKTIMDAYQNETTLHEWLGTVSLDYKLLVEKHGYVELADKKLNTAAEHYINESKLDYEEQKSLSSLYFNDFQKFMEYNIQDVHLLVKMEKKLKFLELVYTLAYMFHCNAGDTMATVQPWSCMTYWKLHNRGEEQELKPVFMGDTDYLGGYVSEPKPGMYRWPVAIDAASLYPSMLQQYNLGIETQVSENDAYKIRMLLVKELNEHEQTEYVVKLKTLILHGDLLHEVYWQNPIEFKTLKRMNVCMAPNCTFYRIDKQSVFSEFCEEIYAGRKIVKKEMLVHEQELIDYKHGGDGQIGYYEEIERLESLIAQKNNLQMAYKIAMNSLYGAIANKWFREHYKLSIAEAITSAGQTGIQFISHRMNVYLNKRLNTVDIKYAFYNDTDSAYLVMDNLVTHVFGNDPAKYDYMDVVRYLDKLFSDEIEPLLIEWAEELSNALNCKKNKLIFKREAIATNGIWSAKKRYAMMVSNNEGVQFDKPKLKFTGLAAKSASTPKFCREWLKECYVIALTGTEKQIHDKVKEVKSIFMNMKPHEMASPKAANNFSKWASPDGDEICIKGTPIAVKAGLNHNFMLKKMNLSHITPLVSDNKLMFLKLKKGAPYGLGVIGFDSFLPEEFNLDKYIDRQGSFDANFVSGLNIFINVIGWDHEPKASVMDFFM